MLSISVYSLNGSLQTEEANVIVLPGINGDIGVVEGDRFLTYLLKEGIIYFIKNEQTFKRLFVFGGRFLAEKNSVTITTEYELLDLDKISLEDINIRIKKAEQNLSEAELDFAKDFYAEHLSKENTLLSLYKEKLY